MTIIKDFANGWWCVQGVWRHKVSEAVAAEWTYLGAPTYTSGSFRDLLINSTRPTH